MKLTIKIENVWEAEQVCYALIELERPLRERVRTGHMQSYASRTEFTSLGGGFRSKLGWWLG